MRELSNEETRAVSGGALRAEAPVPLERLLAPIDPILEKVFDLLHPAQQKAA